MKLYLNYYFVLRDAYNHACDLRAACQVMKWLGMLLESYLKTK